MDQKLLCCGKLFFAELKQGRIVLECCQCGQRWVKGPDDVMIPSPAGMEYPPESDNGRAARLLRRPNLEHDA